MSLVFLTVFGRTKGDGNKSCVCTCCGPGGCGLADVWVPPFDSERRPVGRHCIVVGTGAHPVYDVAQNPARLCNAVVKMGFCGSAVVRVGCHGNAVVKEGFCDNVLGKVGCHGNVVVRVDFHGNAVVRTSCYNDAVKRGCRDNAAVKVGCHGKTEVQDCSYQGNTDRLWSRCQEWQAKLSSGRS